MAGQKPLLTGQSAGWTRGIVKLRPPLQQLRQRQHDNDAENADRHVGGAPAIAGDRRLHEGRPEGTGDVVAARHDRNRDAALAQETVLVSGSASRPYRSPRPHAASAEELARHDAFMAGFSEPIWSRG